MYFSITQALKQFKRDLIPYLSPKAIHQACQQAGHKWRERLLDPVTTIHLFVLQILHCNTAINHLRHPSGLDFTDSAYCQARRRLRCLGRQRHARPESRATGARPAWEARRPASL